MHRTYFSYSESSKMRDSIAAGTQQILTRGTDRESTPTMQNNSVPPDITAIIMGQGKQSNNVPLNLQHLLQKVDLHSSTYQSSTAPCS